MMKKITLLLMLILFSLNITAQTIFFEDFDSQTVNATPANFTVLNEDACTINNPTIFVNQTWTVREDDDQGKVAASQSWTPTACQVDDWLITAAIDLTGYTNVNLTWKAKSYETAFLENYEVLLSTTGVAISDFTNTLKSVTSEADTWTDHTVSLNAYTGGNIYIAFRLISTDMSQLFIDEIKVKAPYNKDMAMTSLMANQVVVGATDIDITGTVTNEGSDDVTDFEIEWTDGTTTETHSVTGVNLTYGQTYNFTHSVPVSLLTGEGKVITVTVVQTGDSDNSNNSAVVKLSSLAFQTTKVVVGEEATGTWCGWCPRGHVYMEQLKNDYPDTWIGIAVHNNDPMAVAAYDAAYSSYHNGYPSGSIDRIEKDVDPLNFPARYLARISEIAPGDLDIDVVVDNDSLAITVEAQFASDFSASDYRISIVIVENNVKGTSSGYNQVNYYSGGGSALNGAGVNWQTAADPVPAADMVYHDVARAFIGGFDGDVASIPNDVQSCVKYTYDFSYVLPNGADHDNYEIIALLIDNKNADKEIVNAKKTEIGHTNITDDNDPIGCKTDAIVNLNIVKEFNVFPNPTSDILNIKIETKNSKPVEINIIDITGQLVSTVSTKENLVQLNIDFLSQGLYLINVVSEGKSIATSSVIVE